VYDMYHWDQPDPAAGNGTERPARRADAADRPRHQVNGDGCAGLTARPAPAARAVQVALDRRDNGGDPGAQADK